MKYLIAGILTVVAVFCVVFSLSDNPSDLITTKQNIDKYILTDEQQELLNYVIDTETEWLASIQLENGAIPMNYADNGDISVNPYFADFAALAMLDDYEKYSADIISYIEWHFSHLNTKETDYNHTDGTIYDYTVTMKDGEIIKEAITEKDGRLSYDSTDSYAATFLMVLDKYLEKSGDTEYILSRKNDIRRVSEALFTTMNHGLTYAKPDYEIKYLMDNCEVYKGLSSAVNLFEIISDVDISYKFIYFKCKYSVARLSSVIENKLWDKKEKHYYTAVDKKNKEAIDFSWIEFYPSATSQLFPIAFGLIPTNCERSEMLYDTFCGIYNWEEFDIPDSFCWGSNAYTAAVMNDVDRVITYLSHYKQLMEKHEYPLYNADAAKVAMAAYLILDNNSL